MTMSCPLPRWLLISNKTERTRPGRVQRAVRETGLRSGWSCDEPASQRNSSLYMSVMSRSHTARRACSPGRKSQTRRRLKKTAMCLLVVLTAVFDPRETTLRRDESTCPATLLLLRGIAAITAALATMQSQSCQCVGRFRFPPGVAPVRPVSKEKKHILIINTTTTT
jgi:hypothetical protein